MGLLCKLFMALVGLFLRDALGKHIPSFAGPYRITIRNINNETSEYNSTGRLWGRLYLTPPRPKQPQYIWGNVYNNVYLKDDYRLEIRVSKWSNNQWKRNAFVMNFDRSCTTMVTHGKCMLFLMFGSESVKCPKLETGFRRIRNQTFVPVFPVVPILPYGRYLFTMAFLKGNETVGVVVADGNAEPKL